MATVAQIEANRANYTQNVVDKLHRQGVVEAVEHWKEERGLPLPAQFLLESGRLVAQTTADAVWASHS